MTTYLPLTYGSHVTLRINEYWFSGSGNVSGCASLPNGSCLGISKSVASTYVLNSATGAPTGSYVQYGDLLNIVDLCTNLPVLLPAPGACITTQALPGVAPLIFSFVTTTYPAGPLMAPYFIGPGQSQDNYQASQTNPVYFPSGGTLMQVGYLNASTSNGGQVTLGSSSSSISSIYIVSYQPPSGPSPVPYVPMPSPNVPVPYNPMPGPSPIPYVPMPPNPPSKSKVLLYASILTTLTGLGVGVAGYIYKRMWMMYLGLAMAVGGGGMGVYYLEKE